MSATEFSFPLGEPIDLPVETGPEPVEHIIARSSQLEVVKREFPGDPTFHTEWELRARADIRNRDLVHKALSLIPGSARLTYLEIAGDLIYMDWEDK